MSRAVLVEVKPRHRDEPVARLIKRFVKKCKKERVVENYRDRMYYEKPSIVRKREKARRKRVIQKLQAKIDNSLGNN